MDVTSSVTTSTIERNPILFKKDCVVGFGKGVLNKYNMFSAEVKDQLFYATDWPIDFGDPGDDVITLGKFPDKQDLTLNQKYLNLYLVELLDPTEINAIFDEFYINMPIKFKRYSALQYYSNVKVSDVNFDEYNYRTFDDFPRQHTLPLALTSVIISKWDLELTINDLVSIQLDQGGTDDVDHGQYNITTGSDFASIQINSGNIQVDNFPIIEKYYFEDIILTPVQSFDPDEDKHIVRGLRAIFYNVDPTEEGLITDVDVLKLKVLTVLGIAKKPSP